MTTDSKKGMTRKKNIDSDSKGKQFNLYMLTDNRIILYILLYRNDHIKSESSKCPFF